MQIARPLKETIFSPGSPRRALQLAAVLYVVAGTAFFLQVGSRFLAGAIGSLLLTIAGVGAVLGDILVVVALVQWLSRTFGSRASEH